MADTQSFLVPSHQSPDQHERSRQVDSAAWAVFFIWVGIAMLTQVPWPWFLVGVGVLILSAQIMRRQWNLRIKRFFVAVGLIILAGGAWDLLALPWPFMPILLIALGGYLLWKTLSRAESP